MIKKHFIRLTWLFLGLVLVTIFVSCWNSKEKPAVQNESVIEKSNILQDSLTIPDTAAVSDTEVVKFQKINKKNLVVKEWNTDARTNVRMLDHVTTFNADGQKIEEIEYNSEGQKWRERYEYATNGKKVRELIYDGLNRLVQVKKYQYNEYGKKNLTYTYNAQGKIIAIKNYEYLTQE